MQQQDVKKWVNALSEKERMILASFEGGKVLPESIHKYWNRKALDKLVDQGLMQWTIEGYELSEDGMLLAHFIYQQDKAIQDGVASLGNATEFCTIFNDEGDMSIEVKFKSFDGKVRSFRMQPEEITKLINPLTNEFFTEMIFDDWLFPIRKIEIDPKKKKIVIRAG